MNDDKNTYSEDGLERFFQKGVQDYHFEFQEEDWISLEKQLGNKKSEKRRYFLIGFLTSLCLFLGLLMGLWLFDYSSKTSKNSKYQSKSNTKDFTVSNKNSDKVLKYKKGKTQENQSNEQSEVENINQAHDDSKINSTKHPFYQNNFKTTLANSSSLFASQGDVSKNKIIITQSNSKNDSIKLLQKNTIALDYLKPKFILPDTLEIEQNLESLDSFKPEMTPLKSTRSRWALSLSFSPDLSSTNLSEYTKPGQKIGLSVEYALSKRFVLSTGLFYARKNYKAGLDEYEIPEKFWQNWANGNSPESISATCEIIDIPINLKAYINPNKQNRLFVSAGLSSYFLLDEVYDYQYTTEDTKDWVTEWQVSNENTHLLGIANFSVGYEWQLNKNFALQVEPFIKAPLGRVGFGRVNLYSTGVLFNIKYQFAKK